MTKEREEILISSVGNLTGVMERVIEDLAWIKENMVGKSDLVAQVSEVTTTVACVEKDVDGVTKALSAHIRNHHSRKALIATWTGIVSSIGVGLFAAFRK